jgi:hypothetical protein
MASFERLLTADCTEGPDCRCGVEMKIARTERVPDQSDAHIRVYNCGVCCHEMRLTVWADELLD